MIAIVDYGMGNLGSIHNMLKYLEIESVITSDPDQISSADKLILPGVGHFDSAMTRLNEMGLTRLLTDRVMKEKVPVLGICLGIQLFTKRSEEGKMKGLGWIDAETVRFQVKDLKVPHMGWNLVKPVKKSFLFDGMYDEPRFYFVHSYHLRCRDMKDVLTMTNYGYDFASSVHRGNIMGTQFHPEKSHKFGMKILENFGRKKC